VIDNHIHLSRQIPAAGTIFLRILSAGLSLLVIVAVWAGTARAQADAPDSSDDAPSSTNATPRTRERVDDPLTVAIRALQQETRNATRQKQPFPRTTSDYFSNAEKRPEPADVLRALGRRLGNTPPADAYIKWQLLSALPDTLDDRQSLRLAELLVTAPAPAPLPGITPEEKRDLDRELRKLTKDTYVDFNTQWANHVSKASEVNTHILSYRDALAMRLPSQPLAIRARLEDLQVRVNAGISVGKSPDQAFAQARTWAILANSSDIEQLIPHIDEFARRPLQTAYEMVEIKNDVLVWKTRKLNLDTKKLETLAKDLREQARQNKLLEAK
jgi:hypothetical protein